MKAIPTAVLVGSLFVGLAGPVSALAAARGAAPAQAAVPAAAQPKAEPFDLAKERAKAAGSFLRVRDSRERRDPFENPLKALAVPATAAHGLPEQEQAKLVNEAELAMGLYNAATSRGETASANVHLSRVMEILGEEEKFTVPELRQRLDAVRTAVGGQAAIADQKLAAVKEAFDAGDYERVAALYADVTKFVDALPKEERDKLAARLSETQKMAQRAAARLAFAKLPLTITGVVISDTGSYTTVNGLVLAVGDLVRRETAGKAGRVPLSMSEPLDPPVKVAEIHLSEVVFEFQGERLSREVGRRYLVEQRATRAAPARAPRR
jgi:hypothetical protein